MTRDASFQAQHCRVATSRDNALAATGSAKEVMIIGGEEIFKEFLPITNRIYLTVIDTKVEGDTFFPIIDGAQWREVEHEEHVPNEKNKYRYTFITLEKK